VEKHKGKIEAGTLRHRWADNIKMYLKERGCEDVNWIHLTQGRAQW